MSANVRLSTDLVQAATSGSGEGERVALARDLADLLMEFSLALGHQSAYPQGHPMLLAAAERLSHTLGAVLAGRETLTLGIARRQFIINGVATDPRSEFLGKLAQRFHRHRIAAVRFDRGITQEEISALLLRLSSDPRRDPGPLGLQPEDSRSWTHAQLYPARYEGLELQSDGEPVAPGDGPPEVQLWLEMARAALPDGAENASGNTGNPAVLAAAINRHVRDATYDQTVIGYLLQMADEVVVGESVEQAWLRRRLSRLISSLEPAAMQRLLDMSGTALQRRKFVLDASQTLAADAVVKVVEAAAESSQVAISDNLILLLGKLAHHAESAVPEVATAAEAALRENVGQLVSDWNLEDPNPEAYSSVLQQMARTAPVQGSELVEFVLEPEQMLQIALEIGETGPRVQAAAERLVATGRIRRLTELLDQAPDAGGAAEGLWGHLVTPTLLAQELAVQPTDFALVERFALRLGDKAAEPLLDALASADDRSARWNLIRILTALGAPVARVVAARLPGAPWFVQRNLLVLLARLGHWPDEFSPSQYTSHPEARVRREAYRLMVEMPASRDTAIREGLADPDPTIVAMMLRAAATGCPPGAMPMVERVLLDGAWSLEVRLLAVRVIAVARAAGAQEHLLSLVRRPRRWWWWSSRLASKSPMLLAALKALADGWASDPEVVPVLAEAARHRDPEIRASVSEAGA